MGLNREIQDMLHEMIRWRQKLHAEPEKALEERTTARFITRQLQYLGLDVHNISKTGVVGVLHGKGGAGGKAIMLHANIDAQEIHEKTDVAHASKKPGLHHAAGHDGHIAMLLGAAKHLAETQNFDGTVYFVFQPAEEKSAARDLIKDGLFEKFPCDEVYGLHSYPDLALGTMASAPGTLLAASEEFRLKFTGKGGVFGTVNDKMALVNAAADLALALKELAAKEIPAGSPAAVAISALHTESLTDEQLPDAVYVQGYIRAHDPELQEKLRVAVDRIVQSVAEKNDVKVVFAFTNERPPVVNSAAETDIACDVAKDIVGDTKLGTAPPFALDTDDFSHYLKSKPGNLMIMGTGRTDGKPSPGLYSAKYDFNDAALPIGASYWVGLVEKVLPLSKPKPAAAPKPPQL